MQTTEGRVEVGGGSAVGLHLSSNVPKKKRKRYLRRRGPNDQTTKYQNTDARYCSVVLLLDILCYHINNTGEKIGPSKLSKNSVCTVYYIPGTTYQVVGVFMCILGPTLVFTTRYQGTRYLLKVLRNINKYSTRAAVHFRCSDSFSAAAVSGIHVFKLLL